MVFFYLNFYVFILKHCHYLISIPSLDLRNLWVKDSLESLWRCSRESFCMLNSMFFVCYIASKKMRYSTEW